MKTVSLPCLLLATATLALANTAPTVVIQSAQMRPGTTLMDVVYRVNDPDDATVKTRALVFVDGVRSFANVIKPVTFAEGTAAKLGDAIAANVDHTLTWDTGADWDVDLGQVKLEVLAMDNRGLLPFDWITIPATAGNPQTTVSRNSPTDAEVIDALFWLYAGEDSGLSVADGVLTCIANDTVLEGVALASGSTPQTYSTPFVLKAMNLDPGDGLVINAARAGLIDRDQWHAHNRPYAGISLISGWGNNSLRQLAIPAGLAHVTAVAAGNSHSLALKVDGTVSGWGGNWNGQATVPAGLTGVTAISAGQSHSLALKSDGTVVGWGSNEYGQTTIPAGLTNVIAIAAGGFHSVALKSDGSVVGWPLYYSSELTNVTAIAAGYNHCLALKSDGTVVGWGSNDTGQSTIPAGLSQVTAISAGNSHSLALKSDGTVVEWGFFFGQATVPAGLTDVAAIATSTYHSLALKRDGTVVGWGLNQDGAATGPAGVSGVTAIAAGAGYSLILKGKAP